ncbi:COG4 transport protein-domain-containing protein [Talaromyces proteolyticus]|uniref:Conserved oligomeric Golgi complex subunit 4 n=1 Tax=Talaromyces proteolyticus TaxID=1131652 RepID=A0AAD4KZG5_9EURO|nr:COG4 transport protein-domain-containing protein [Talaromyces proteolyticus]KAH8704747.1 COG4 transport protein-domain-containing protein [Talaromyces proteolyticus]
MSKTNGIADSNGHAVVQPSSSSPDIFNASSVSEIKATLLHLHDQEAAVTARLDALVASQKDFSRELGRLDFLRAHLGSQASTTRNISNGMLSGAAATAGRLSSAVRRLDLEQVRVKATLEVVEQVSELKACVLGVTGSMEGPQDWETAASYLNRASKIPPEVVNGAFAARIVPTAEVPDPPNVTLKNASESLCGLFLREFDKAVKENNGAKITRFFKLFPLIGRSEVGLDVYGRYVCQGVASRARSNLSTGAGSAQGKDGYFYANALTKLFEHIAQIVDGHGGLVERHYGLGKMTRVIERLQVEADVQGGIIIDTWGDEKNVDRKLTDIKSYAFTFLVQSFLPAQRSTGTPRTGSPANRDGGQAAASEDEGVDMKEVDSILNELAVMLGRWSLYSRFLADNCRVKDENTDISLTLPDFLVGSSLAKKIRERLITPFNAMTTFFFRRSVEKAFQLDEQPSGLTLNPHKALSSEPPHITSAVDDIMYIVNKVLRQSIATSQKQVVINVVPTLSRILGADFIGMVQRKMRDEYYPKPPVQGAQPPEQTVIAFLVLINNLDVAVDYIRRIVSGHVDSKQNPGDSTSGNGADEAPGGLESLFPLSDDAAVVTQALQSLSTSFESKANDLLSDGIQVVFNNVVKNRLRPILADSFRDIEYQPQSADDPTSTYQSYDHEDDEDDEASRAELVRPRFATAWAELLLPISRILTPAAFNRLLTATVAYLARLLEKRLWSYHGRVNPLGATRLERDIAGIVNAVIEVGGTQGAPIRYRHRDAFARCVQMTMVMAMDDDEWEDVVRGGEAAEVVDKLQVDERSRARAMVR